MIITMMTTVTMSPPTPPIAAPKVTSVALLFTSGVGLLVETTKNSVDVTVERERQKEGRRGENNKDDLGLKYNNHHFYYQSVSRHSII